MAHKQQLSIIGAVANHLCDDWSGKNIIEIGSYDVNGSIRHLFPKSNYIGVDLTEGPGVDLVCEGDKVDYPDNHFDASISCECFEHNPKWVETIENMHRMTKAGGVLIFTCASTGRLEHGTTRTSPKSSPGTSSLGWDYYLNLTKSDIYRKVDINKLFSSHFLIFDKYSCTLSFVGIKAGASGVFSFDKARLEQKCIEESKKCHIEDQASNPNLAAVRYAALIGKLPVKLAACCLPDRQYQHFAFYYIKFANLIKAPFK